MANTTKYALAAALRELLQKTTLDNITVKDIVNQAGVSRQTFYYHFGDVYQLLEWAFQDIVSDLCAPANGSWRDRLLLAVSLLRANRSLVMNVCHSLGAEYLGIGLRHAIHPIAEQSASRKCRELGLDEQETDFAISFFTYGVVGIIIEWVRKGMPEDLDYMIDRIHEMLQTIPLRIRQGAR